jgi:hypothetical protein
VLGTAQVNTGGKKRMSDRGGSSLCASRLRLGKPPRESDGGARRPYPRYTWSASRHGAAAPLFQSVGAPLRRGPTFAAAAVAVFGNGTKYSIGICEAGGDT